jgi:hypothetical protein
MPEREQTVPIKIGETTVLARVRQTHAGEEEIAWTDYGFDEVVSGIKAIVGQLETAFAAVKPTKAGVEFSVDLTVQAGKVVALLFESDGTAGLKVNLEWDLKRGSVEPNAEV